MLGTINPIEEIARLAHDAGALLVVDGAQAGPKLELDMAELGADFYAVTGHKMYGPTGIGALFGRRELLEEMPPFIGGGSMIRKVTKELITWADLPAKFEGGTPPIGEAIGFGAAVRWIDELGLPAIHAAEAELTAYALERVAEVPGLTIFGPPAGDERGGIVSFDMEGVHAHDISEILDRHGVAVRAGHHCAQVLMQRLGVPATTRASFAVYNTRAEVDRLVDGLLDARQRLRALGTVEAMDELYRDQILEHYKRPHHFGRLEDFDLEFEDNNPFCGDEQHVFLKLDEDGKVSEVAFEGQGCAISTAATSLLDRRARGDDPRGDPQAAQGLRPRPARHRHLGDADEVRDARPQGRQGRQPRRARRLGGRGRAGRPGRSEAL